MKNMKAIKKKLSGRRQMAVLWGTLSNSLYKNIFIFWLLCMICLVVYYEVMIKPAIFPIRYFRLERPPDFNLEPIPLNDRLVDKKRFEFLINPSCEKSSTFIIALVPSAPGHYLHREMVRITWGKQIKVFFLLGLNEEFSKDIEQENYFYADLIQGNFIDSYKNMTYKHVMGLKWAATFCPAVKYVLKADDDVFVNVPSLYEWLITLSPYGVEDLIACQMETHREVHRYKESKWNVPYSVYPDKYYPEYCRGWAVVYSQDVVISLYHQTYSKNYFWIDDVYVTGFLAERKRKRITHLSDLAVTDNAIIRRIIEKKYNERFLFVLTTPNKFASLFDAIN